MAICLLHAYAKAGARAGAPPGARGALPPRLGLERDQRGVPRVRARGARPCSTPRSCRWPRATSTICARLPAAAPLHLLHSAGGMMSVEAAKARPLTMAMSGPAAGVAAAAHTARALGIARALAFDMGGTTTDVCLIADGVPETAGQRKLGDYPVRLPMLAVESIGAGGGSIARVEAHGRPQGRAPERGRGARARVLRAGRHGADGDRRQPDPRLSQSRAGLRRRRSGSTAAARRRRSRRWPSASACRSIAAAHGVVEVANANMLRALRLVSVQRGYDLREFALIAYGGAGPLHAGALARAGGDRAGGGARALRRVLRARLSRLAAALRRGPDVSRAPRRVGREGGRGPLPRARGASACARSSTRATPPTGARDAEPRPPLRGQNYEIEVPCGDRRARRARAAFEQRHRQLYGYATGESVECVNLRVAAPARSMSRCRCRRRRVAGQPRVSAGSHRAFFPETGEVDAAALRPRRACRRARRSPGPPWSRTSGPRRSSIRASAASPTGWATSSSSGRPRVSAALDPVTLEVVRNALYAIAEEMSVIVMRSARSPLLKEAGDLSSALTDAAGAAHRPGARHPHPHGRDGLHGEGVPQARARGDACATATCGSSICPRWAATTCRTSRRCGPSSSRGGWSPSRSTSPTGPTSAAPCPAATCRGRPSATRRGCASRRSGSSRRTGPERATHRLRPVEPARPRRARGRHLRPVRRQRRRGPPAPRAVRALRRRDDRRPASSGCTTSPRRRCARRSARCPTASGKARTGSTTTASTTGASASTCASRSAATRRPSTSRGTDRPGAAAPSTPRTSSRARPCTTR